MATYYNSVIAYDDATVAYDGSPVVFTYAGNIELTLQLRHVYYDGANYTYYYDGNLGIDMLVGAVYNWGAMNIPTTGLTLRIVPNSTILIRQYRKIKDPVRIGGCPQCGTYLYNK
jgi:hypothetical protein